MSRCILDTSLLIEMFDRGNEVLLECILKRCRTIYIPCIVMYEYLYGHKYLGRDINERKKVLEKLGIIVWITQDVLLKALEIDIKLRKQGLTIPFSDVLIATTSIALGAELISLDERHYSRIKELKLYIPRA